MTLAAPTELCAGPSRTWLEHKSTLVGLLRPVAVAAFHLGAAASDLRAALERAMEGIFNAGAGGRGQEPAGE